MSWANMVSVIDCSAREIVNWEMSNSCGIEGALAVVEEVVLERLATGVHVSIPAGQASGAPQLDRTSPRPSLSSA